MQSFIYYRMLCLAEVMQNYGKWRERPHVVEDMGLFLYHFASRNLVSIMKVMT